jgi:hypothetical protein
VKLKKPKPWMPLRASSLLTTRLGAVATSVSMPLSRAATLKGIIRRLGGVPVFCAIRRTIGMKMATTPVELITAPKAPTTSISSTTSRVSLLPARATSQSPSRCATAVRTKPSPITNKAAISTTLASLKPARASPMVTTPVNGSVVSTISATASMRGRLSANIATAAVSRASTTARSNVTGRRPKGEKASRSPHR